MTQFRIDYSQKPSERAPSLSAKWPRTVLGFVLIGGATICLGLIMGVSRYGKEVQDLTQERNSWVLRYDSVYADKLHKEREIQTLRLELSQLKKGALGK